MKTLSIILGVACFVSAMIAVVAAQHDRDLTRKISDERARIQTIEVRYAELQLEEGALSAQGRIQRIAEDRLHMHPPAHDQIQVVFR